MIPTVPKYLQKIYAMLNTSKKLLNFLLEFVLAIISYILKPFVEIATFVVVLFKYKIGALNYFDGKGLEADYRSARDNRSFWNFLFVKKAGNTFTKTMNMTISAKLGENAIIKKLTITGWFMYYFLWIIDISNWFKGGHCYQAYKAYKNRQL